MLLFNQYRNAQQNFTTGNTVITVNWKTDLNTNPVYGAESTATIDDNGNLYFGSHSGNFYSLTKNGKIRWVFTTKSKIYSSPLIYDNKLFFAGGDGFIYALSSDNGNLVWKMELSESLNLTRNKKALSLLTHLPHTFDIKRRKNIIYKSWASPIILNAKIYVTGYGKGLFCFNPQGELIWEYDLGFPRYQLSGVAANGEDKIFCTSRRGWVMCLNSFGELIWEQKVNKFWEPWGTPVYCNKKKKIYFSFSNKEKIGFVYAYSEAGKALWATKIGAIRGSTTINQEGDALICCDLDGFIYKLDAVSGKIIKRKKITNCARGLWITPTLDVDGNILLSTKDSNNSGRVIKLKPNFEITWEFKTNKVLSIPLVLPNGDILFGSWDGYYYSIKTIS